MKIFIIKTAKETGMFRMPIILMYMKKKPNTIPNYKRIEKDLCIQFLALIEFLLS